MARGEHPQVRALLEADAVAHEEMALAWEDMGDLLGLGQANRQAAILIRTILGPVPAEGEEDD